MGLSDKPGVLGAVGSLGNVVKQSATNEVKRTVKNAIEQLDITGNKENKEKLAETSPGASYLTQEKLKKESQETVDWLYGTSSSESTPTPVVEKSVDAKPANIAQQVGIKKEVNTNVVANPLEQIGGGQSAQNNASIMEQLGMSGSSNLTPEEQAKLQQMKSRLHQDYYARIRQDYHQSLQNPQKQSDTEERQKEAMEEQETQQQRMERLMQEDLQKRQEEEEKKKAVDQSVEMAQNTEKHRGASG